MPHRFIAAIVLLSWLHSPISAADKAPNEKAAVRGVSPRAKEMAEAMKASANEFSLTLQYHGSQGKPFYRLTVSVPPVIRRRSSPFERIVQIKVHDAKRIIGHLAKEGFFDRAHKSGKLKKLPQPCYLLTAQAGQHRRTELLGWGSQMLRRLDSLQTALPDNGKNDMKLLLGRLSGYRAKWEAEKKRETHRAKN